jgi:hypothetical protein
LAYSFDLKSLSRDDVLRVERGGYARHAFGELVHEVLGFVGIAGRQGVDLPADFRILERLVVEKSLRMDLDRARDDELLAGKTDAVVRKERKPERLVRIAEVHEDARLQPPEFLQRHAIDVERKTAGIDVTRLALGARHGRFVAGVKHGRAAFRADDRRHTELSAEDRRVAGAAAAIGDDRGCLLHDRLPIGVRFVGDEDLAVDELLQTIRRVDDPHPAGGDALADRSAGHELVAVS